MNTLPKGTIPPEDNYVTLEKSVFHIIENCPILPNKDNNRYIINIGYYNIKLIYILIRFVIS